MDTLLSLDEQKIRKRWLFWRIKFPAYFFTVAASLIVIVILGMLGFGPKDYEHAIKAVKVLAASALGLSIVLGSLYFLYYCAYKKFGNGWLTLAMLAIAFNLIKDLLSLNQIQDPIELAILIVLFSYQSFLLVLDYKLRKVNKLYRARAMLSSEEYIAAAASFQQASNLEELDERFHHISKQYDSSQSRLILSEAYKGRKKELEKAAQGSLGC